MTSTVVTDLRRVRQPSATPAMAAGGAAVYLATAASIDPYADHIVGCPFLAITGWWCPGCGSTRAAHELAHGDLSAAVACHPLALPMLGLLTYIWFGWVARRRGSTARWAASPTTWPLWVPSAIGIAFVVVGVARNLPGLEWLAPPEVSP